MVAPSDASRKAGGDRVDPEHVRDRAFEGQSVGDIQPRNVVAVPGHLPPVFRLVVEIEGEYLESHVPEALVGGLKVRNLGETRCAPGSPEFQQRVAVLREHIGHPHFFAGQVHGGDSHDRLRQGRRRVVRPAPLSRSKVRLAPNRDSNSAMIVICSSSSPSSQAVLQRHEPGDGIVKIPVDHLQRFGRRLARLRQGAC